ncbi:glycosyltransferase family 2 protein [Marinilabilia rubra]|uniref:Glycosyltransferase n=1 Tax=Marinilabilia rubra TaxID=2162893 RepID=A0A2U2B3X0_9BACT|nr:glycosyltransferase family 2 protein [Marinilabilia rubra]PWD97758.1 glycosyltransferase [Marinilabilia rubra]
MDTALKLSIITVNLNNANGLHKTIDSVINQTYTNFEHIIIDGYSTDDSVKVIKKYEALYKNKQRHLYWISEPDKGIYNGMNKGIKVAKGEYCLFLNSGDWLLNSDILKLVLKDNAIEDILYGDIMLENGDYTYPDSLSFYDFYTASIGHPASFIKTDLLFKLGLYNERFKIVSDWEFFLKALFINRCSYRHIRLFTTFFAPGGFSTQKKMTDLHKKERTQVLNEYFYWLIKDYSFFSHSIEELNYYKNSRLIQLFRKIQASKIYKLLRASK